MLLPLSRAIAPDLDWRERCASTNTELVARASSSADLAVIATDTQTAGRGRLERVWSTPSGTALAVSVLVRLDGGPAATGDAALSSGRSAVSGDAALSSGRSAVSGDAALSSGRSAASHDAASSTHRSAADVGRAAPALDPRRLGWLPLVAGVAMTRAVQSLGVERAGLKWPNDVLVDDRKLSGILTELTSDGVVIGAGLNLSMTQADLPVPTATSLVIEGVPSDGGLDGGPDGALTDRALAAYLGELLPLIAQWRTAEFETLPSLVVPHLQTLGRAVRVERPGLPVTLGTAVRLDDDGRLVVQPSTQGSALIAVAAGDVTHLRYE